MRNLGIIMLGVCAVLLTGCGEPKAELSKAEEKQLRAPLGQPMPEEARKAMAEGAANAAKATGKPAPK